RPLDERVIRSKLIFARRLRSPLCDMCWLSALKGGDGPNNTAHLPGPAFRPRSGAVLSSALTNKRSVLPVRPYKTKGVAGSGHPHEGRERQMSGNQRLAGRRQLAQQADTDADRLLGVVVESVVPVGAVEVIREHRIADERQPVAAGRQADHTVPGRVPTGAT